MFKMGKKDKLHCGEWGFCFDTKKKLKITKIKFALLKIFKNPVIKPMIQSNVDCGKIGLKVRKT